MKKLLIIGLIVAIAVFFGVKYSVEYASGLGKDVITFSSGERLTTHIKGYSGGRFQFDSEYGVEIVERDATDIRRIVFSGKKSGGTPDTLTFESGETVKCKVLSYERGRMSIRRADGRTMRGGVHKIRLITFGEP
jgi:hypothetical protein